MFKKILVPLSANSHNHALVEAACQLAKALGASLRFYHAQASYFPPLMSAEALVLENSALEAFNRAVEAESERLLAAAKALAEASGIACEAVCEPQDNPYEGIVTYAKKAGCDLIFMASHGRKGLAAWVLGAQTQKVVALSSVPVLVYRESQLADISPECT